MWCQPCLCDPDCDYILLALKSAWAIASSIYAAKVSSTHQINRSGGTKLSVDTCKSIWADQIIWIFLSTRTKIFQTYPWQSTLRWWVVATDHVSRTTCITVFCACLTHKKKLFTRKWCSASRWPDLPMASVEYTHPTRQSMLEGLASETSTD